MFFTVVLIKIEMAQIDCSRTKVHNTNKRTILEISSRHYSRCKNPLSRTTKKKVTRTQFKKYFQEKDIEKWLNSSENFGTDLEILISNN